MKVTLEIYRYESEYSHRVLLEAQREDTFVSLSRYLRSLQYVAADHPDHVYNLTFQCGIMVRCEKRDIIVYDNTLSLFYFGIDPMKAAKITNECLEERNAGFEI